MTFGPFPGQAFLLTTIDRLWAGLWLQINSLGKSLEFQFAADHSP